MTTSKSVDRASADPTLDSRARGTVAVHEATSEGLAREVASRLLQANIPAAVEVERSDAAWVIVPWDKQHDAELMLRRWGLPVIPRFGSGGGFDIPALPRRDARPELQLIAGDLREDDDPFRAREDAYGREDEDDGPVDITMPDSGPVMPRLVVALSAIGFGIGMQRALELWLGGPEGARDAMAAKGSLLSQPWRLVTAGFYHFGLEHLASNLVFGLMFGLVLFGTHGVGAAMMAWLMGSIVGIGIEAAASPWVYVAGASAGNYALVGLWAHGQVDRARRAFLPRRERIKALGVVLMLAPGALTPMLPNGTKVAVLAHAVGFFAGYLIGTIFERRVVADELEAIDGRSRAGQWIALAIVFAAFVAGFAHWIRA